MARLDGGGTGSAPEGRERESEGSEAHGSAQLLAGEELRTNDREEEPNEE